MLVFDALMGGFIAVVLTALIVGLIAGAIAAGNRADRAERELRELRDEQHRRRLRQEALARGEEVVWSDVTGRRK